MRTVVFIPKYTFHKKIKLALGKACKNFPKVSKLDPPQLKINCLTKNCDCVMKYDPDFCLWYKPHRLSKQTIVFEIIDSQDEPKTIADVIRMKLLRNCRKGFFICPDEDKYAMAEKVLDVLLSNFKDMLKTKHKKDVLDIKPILIPKDTKIEDIVSVFSKEIEKALP